MEEIESDREREEMRDLAWEVDGEGCRGRRTGLWRLAARDLEYEGLRRKG